MIQKYALICVDSLRIMPNRLLLIVLLAAFVGIGQAQGQILAWQFGNPASAGNEATYTATTIDPNLETSALSRGSGINSTALVRAFSANGYNGNGSAAGTKAQAITSNDYYQFTVNADTGYEVSLSTLDARLRRTAAGPNAYIWMYSINGVDFIEIGTDISFTSTADGVAQTQIDLSNILALQNVASSTTITFRLYAWGASTANASTGTFAIGRFAAGNTNNSLAIGGSVNSAVTTFSVTYDGNGNTGGTAPTDANIYNLGDNVIVLGNPNGLVRTGYTFAGWNTAADGNGTPYAPNSSFSITENMTLYAEWDAITDAVDVCFIQWPNTSPQTITEGDNFDVYARAYEPGVTTVAGPNAGLVAWIGYNTVNNNPDDSWTWVPATYNGQYGNDHEYQAQIGTLLDPGTYYYATRFQLNGGPYRYGGTGGNWNNDSVQLNVIADQLDFCNVDFPKTGTIDQGDNFTVYAQAYEPGVTEAAGQGADIEAWIGYTTVGINHEPWQAAGWTWVLATYDSDFGNNDNYRAQIGSTLPVGTYYYASRFRLNGSSTYSYGGIQNDNVGNFWNAGTFNNGVLVVEGPSICLTEGFEGSTNDPAGWSNFSGYYQNAVANAYSGTYHAGMNSPNDWIRMPLLTDPTTLSFWARTSGTAANFTVRVQYSTDEISWFDSSVIIANGSNTGNITTTYQQFDINLNLIGDYYVRWFMSARTGGSFYLDEVEVECGASTPQPELQLVDANGDDQNCGYTIDFGSQALTTTTDITFDIENTGSANLDITSLVLSGANFADYTIVSPVGAFTVASAGSQEVVVRFTPSANGTRTATLTITNNDANEGACTVLLTGVGFTPAPNIRVERSTEALIANGAAASTGNNTVFATTDLGDTTVPKIYYVRNGNVANPATANLTVNTIASSNNAEFTLVNVPALPVTLAPGEFIAFEIEFSPNSTTPLTRTSTITVTSSDTTDNPYTFGVEGTSGCPIYNGTILPTSGPVGTEITITSAENLTGASATLNGVALTTVSSSTSELIVQVPLTVTLGGALTVQLSNGCSFTNTFTLIDEAIQSCEGSGSAPTELFISQVTDSGTDSVTYIELYNGTGSTITNLNNYSIHIYNNGRSTPINSNFIINLNNVSLPTGSTYTLALGTNPTGLECIPEHNFSNLADQQDAQSGVSINFVYDDDFNLGHDHIRLYNNASHIDSWGVYENESWATSLNLEGKAANFMRNTDATLPNVNFSIADWTIQDWGNSCSDLDYSDIGVYDFSVGTPPTVSTLMVPTSDCDISATLTVTGTEGFNGGGDTQELAYQWYYSAPGDLGWTAIVNNAIYSGATTNTLEILNALTLNGYQYYCQVREDDATCYTASNAVKLTLDLKTWNGSISNSWRNAANWTPAGVPTVNDIVVIPSGPPNPVLTAGEAPIPPTAPVYAKSLILLSGTDLELITGQNLIVENCIVNNGTIDLKNAANLVQVNETNENSGNGNFFMERIVSDVESLNYIYWSSPIGGFNMSGIPGSNTHRYYWSPTAVNANGTQGDWIQTTGIMDEGVGYIIRVAGATPNLNVTLGGNGLGTPQNGTFTTPISKGTHVYADPADDINNNWNLIGNPYPSAISADTFIAENAAQLMNDDPNPAVIGTIYLWRHQATPDGAIDNPFYEDFAINYDGNNYVSYNATGENPAGEFDGNIASGQAFFVVMDDATAMSSVTFTNAMRYGDIVTDAYNNGEFLRTSSDRESLNTTTIERHRLWLDLIAPNNTSVSTLVGYVTGATNDKDRLFDGYETSATGLGFYSMVGYDRMGIQGRALPFVDTDIVPLGVNLLQTGTHTIAINQLDGLFEAGQAIFLEDLYTNIIHNLRATPYTFHSTSGMFNDRFVLRYTNTTLSIPDVTVDAGVTIVELSNGNVKFTVGHNLTITSVEIYDMLGRQLYDLPGTNAVEVYNLANLSQAAYVAKVTLSNGQTVTKRAVKRH